MNKSEHGLLSNNKIIKTPTLQYKHLQPLREFLDTRLLSLEGVFLAGAALQATVCSEDKIFDYDIFFTDKDMVPHAEAVLTREGFVPESLFSFEPEICKMNTYVRDGMRVQLIHATIYESIEKCLETFDFTCTMLAYDGHNYYYTGRALADTLQKRLVVHKLHYPRNTYERIEKYTKVKGYTIEVQVIEMIQDACEENEGESFFYEGDERMANLAVKRSGLTHEDLIDLWS